MLILHDFHLSAECYAVRLLAAFVGAKLETRHVDVYPGREHETASFLALNPFGTVPVLQTGETVFCDWQAILAVLASGSDWWRGGDPQLVEWLGFARLLGASAGLARLHDGMGAQADIAACRTQAHRLLRHLDRHLWYSERSGDSWLLRGARPSAADDDVLVHVLLCD